MKYTLHAHRRLAKLTVRAKGTKCYLVKEDTILSIWGTPRTFLNVAEAQAAFDAVAPPGWEAAIEPAKIDYGTFGTGRLVSRDGDDHPTEANE